MWIDDQILSFYRRDFALKVFVPTSTLVVCGNGNDIQKEVDVEACQRANIPIEKRYGGGGTVVLYPGCVVVSLGCWVKDPFANGQYFQMINQGVISSLKESWPSMKEVSQNGISDIVAGDKKIAGTSLFRSRRYLLYQASILVDLDLELVSSCLRHPSKEPEYRRSRDHKDFLTSLRIIEPSILSAQEVAERLSRTLENQLKAQLAADLIDPVEGEMKALMERLERSKNLQVL